MISLFYFLAASGIFLNRFYTDLYSLLSFFIFASLFCASADLRYKPRFGATCLGLLVLWLGEYWFFSLFAWYIFTALDREFAKC